MPEPGQFVGNYRVIEKIGEGGMGAVFVAEHPDIGRRVALKVLHRNLAENPDAVKRFLTEARVVNAIRHRHIVDIYDFGQTSAGEPYFTMEMLHGEPLAQRLARSRLPIGVAIDIARQVSDAVGAGHSKGTIHRDLKPDNLFLVEDAGRDPFVKVLDFGIAKLVDPKMRVSYRTATGVVAGTPYYMSPEQCAGGRSVDHRSDIYALGVVLFEMVTGRVPFEGEGVGEVMAAHLRDAPPDPRALRRGLPDALCEAITRALQKDPRKRFPTMEAMDRALAAIEMAGEVLAPEDHATERPRAQPPSGGSVTTFRVAAGETQKFARRRQKRLPLLVGVATFAAAITGAALYVARTRPTPQAATPPMPVAVAPPIAVSTPAMPAAASPPPTAPQVEPPAATEQPPEGAAAPTDESPASRPAPGSLRLRRAKPADEAEAHPAAAPIVAPAPVPAPQRRASPPNLWLDVYGQDEVPKPFPKPSVALSEITITSDPPGAHVVDATRGTLGTTPLTLRASAGERLSLRIEKDGFEPARRSRTVGPSEVIRVQLKPQRDVPVQEDL